ncbi:hypothetical protein CC85DRAFT_189049 [Cutaneotrichosporon oleaginosum]|uniref:Uncharacterized protein n=1 Tax=Cutaneotrichosporon oleaginosum TaxID=879819 RepID=A0A0J0XUR8_9TREE|nr:uncharacterized protein CC85DRAFT_189049 [Cutaneotrichosporon oleaginosum]KLT44851.1 hypothetical protein CC85DRAFT_189049 [Cutaneotrichosporon oleaginosum]TXT11987.1 hypothetical protein COLE_02397 [Cutaneotrichosporon oleaginosum]
MLLASSQKWDLNPRTLPTSPTLSSALRDQHPSLYPPICRWWLAQCPCRSPSRRFPMDSKHSIITPTGPQYLVEPTGLPWCLSATAKCIIVVGEEMYSLGLLVCASGSVWVILGCADGHSRPSFAKTGIRQLLLASGMQHLPPPPKKADRPKLLRELRLLLDRLGQLANSWPCRGGKREGGWRNVKLWRG